MGTALSRVVKGGRLQRVLQLDGGNMGSVLSNPEQLVKLEEEWESEKCNLEELIPGKAFYVSHLLSREECQRFRELMESSSDKVVEIGSSEESYRYCSRLVSSQVEAMDQLWTRLEAVMEEQGLLQLEGLEGSDWSAVGLSEMVRVVKYQLGGRFAPHCDGCFTRSVEERSWWTVNIYLNTVPVEAEGATVFLLDDTNSSTTNTKVIDSCSQNEEESSSSSRSCQGGEIVVQPEEGAALLFYQPNLLHKGQPLRAGEKWLLRTDVMFRRNDMPSATEVEARQIHRMAQELETDGKADSAWPLYAKAFKLWPALENEK